MKINEAKTLIKTLLHMAIKEKVYTAVELVSGPGIGKSSIVEQACEEMSKALGEPVGCKPFFLTTVEPPDVRGFGMPSKDSEGRLTMTFTRPPWCVNPEEPKYGILFLDEKAQAQHDVQKPAAELLLNRRVGNYQLPEGWIVVAASNRESDRSGVNRELAFISNRRMLIEIEPNLDAWVEWAETNAIHPMAIAFAKFKPGVVFAEAVPEKGGPFCTPRTLVMASRLVDQFDGTAQVEVVSGLLGKGAGAEFIAFLRVAEEMPKYEDIIKDPTGVPVPKKPDASFAVMQMVAHRVEAKSAGAAFKYLQRMSKEFQVAGLKATFRRCPEMVNTPDFAAWMRANKDLVMAANLLGRKS